MIAHRRRRQEDVVLSERGQDLGDAVEETGVRAHHQDILLRGARERVQDIGRPVQLLDEGRYGRCGETGEWVTCDKAGEETKSRNRR
ncbi:hypothetical protein [Streptomyces sp. NPDC054888]